MKNTIKYIMAASALALLTACGGGGSSGPSVYGSLALRTGGGEEGISTKQNTQSAADAIALNECGRNCQVVVSFFDGQCVAASASWPRGLSTPFYWSLGSSIKDAEDKAKLECIKNGASSCIIYSSACN